MTRALPVLFERALASGRLHSAYLISGPRDAGARSGRGVRARERLRARNACARSAPAAAARRPREEIAIDGTGHSGPLFRRIGDHPDLFWVERGSEDTRVRIGQIRALQHALRLSAGEGGRRVAVIADAEWLNQEAQNALLRLLEEPPPRTSLVLVTASPAGLLATVRSRCQKVALPAERRDPLAAPEAAAWLSRLDALPRTPLPALLDWAEEFRGQRAVGGRAARGMARARLGLAAAADRRARRGRARGARRARRRARAFPVPVRRSCSATRIRR